MYIWNNFLGRPSPQEAREPEAPPLPEALTSLISRQPSGPQSSINLADRTISRQGGSLDARIGSAVMHLLRAGVSVEEIKKLNVKELDLSGMKIGEAELGLISSLGEKVTELNLSGATDETGRLFEVISRLPNLERLNVSEMKISSLDWLERMPHLKGLDLSGNPVDDIAIQKLLFLEEITDLNVSRTSIGRESREVIPRLITLRKLDLSDCHLYGWYDRIETLTNLTDLSIRNILFDFKFANGVNELKNLERLDVSVRGFYPSDHSPLEQMIIGLPKLRVLDMRNRNLYEVLTGPLDYLPSLEELDISGALYATSTLERISKSDQLRKRLKRLGASGICYVERPQTSKKKDYPYGRLELMRALSRFEELEFLDVSENGLSADDLDQLRKKLTTVKSLVVDHNPRVMG